MSTSAYKHFYRGFVPAPSVQELASGVFAYIQHDGSWGLNNGGFVHSGAELAVIDTALTGDRTRRLRATAVERSGISAAKVLINTHHHPDHTFGNYIFSEACIVAHRLCRSAMEAAGLQQAMRMDPVVPWGDIELLTPQIVFDEGVDLHVGEHRLELRYVGPAHSSSDIIVWLPDTGVLFAGDVLFNRVTPITHEGGSIMGSIQALERIKALSPEVIVPGHGELCGVTEADAWLRYFGFVADLAERGLREGVSVLELARRTELGEFADWQDPERLVLNLHRAYAEASDGPGAKVDAMAAFTDMLTLNPSSYGHRIVQGEEAYVSPPHEPVIS
jgi:cyclase